MIRLIAKLSLWQRIRALFGRTFVIEGAKYEIAKGRKQIYPKRGGE